MADEEKTGSELAEYTPIAAGLTELRQRFGSLVFDCRTTAGDKQAREARRELVTLRTTLEAKRKELKAPALERAKLIDSEAKRIEAAIREVETPIDEQISVVEREKEAEKQRRLQAEADALAAIRAKIAEAFAPPRPRSDGKRFTSEDLRQMREQYEALPVSTELFGDLTIEAQESKVRSLAWFDAVLAETLEREAAESELARKREAFLEEQRQDTARRAEERRVANEAQARDDERRARERAAEEQRLEAERKELARRQADLDMRTAAIARQEQEQGRAAAEEAAQRAAAEGAEAERLAAERREREAAEQAQSAREAAARERVASASGSMLSLLRDWRALDAEHASGPTAEFLLGALRARRDALVDDLAEVPA